MAVAIVFGEKRKLLDDFIPADLEKIAARHASALRPLNWLTLALQPALVPDAFYDIVVQAAKDLGEPIPDRPQTIGALRDFLSHLAIVDDDLPTQFDEGGLPLPEAGAKTIDSSSTSPALADGRPSKPVATPTAT